MDDKTLSGEINCNITIYSRELTQKLTITLHSESLTLERYVYIAEISIPRARPSDPTRSRQTDSHSVDDEPSSPWPSPPPQPPHSALESQIGNKKPPSCNSLPPPPISYSMTNDTSAFMVAQSHLRSYRAAHSH